MTFVTTMSTPAWYRKLLRQCREPGELTGVRITTLLERHQETFLRQESTKTKTVFVRTTIAYWSPSPGRIEYAAYRSLGAPDKKMRRLIAVGRLFTCPLILKNENLTDIKKKNCHLCVRSAVQERIDEGHPLRGGRRRQELPSENPLVPKASKPMQLHVPPHVLGRSWCTLK